MKTALICGVSGQDGAYLAKFLIEKNYRVVGTSRDAQIGSFSNLKKLEIFDQIVLASMAPNDFRSVLAVLKKFKPDEIYFLAGQSSVSLSFEQPIETLESISTGCLNLLEAIKFLELDTKFYNAGSSECFGDAINGMATSQTPFAPRSPYAVAKSTSHWLTSNYRNAYGLYACSGILFNHESPLRPDRFVTSKIIQAAVRISKGSKEKLKLGNIQVHRDWGWAPEYVEAMWLMLQQESPIDIVICTGETNSLEKFVSVTFETLGLDYKNFVEMDQEFIRPSEISISRGNPQEAKEKLGWTATSKMKDVIEKLIKAQL